MKVKNLWKYAPKRPRLHHSPQKFLEKHAPNPRANAWLRHASQAPPPPKKNSLPPLANPAYAHELLLRNLFENPRWQTVDCV